MISANALIEKFRYALANLWGYIWGTAGIIWTKAKQKQKIEYMVSKYGGNWKNNSEAKKDNYYSAALYGDKWIDHYVADCSGLFVWAFKELGGAIAHGSNSIYDRYCNAKGNMSGGKKSNGGELLPGTAVFTNHDGDKTHIGLYVGDGVVIEASGTKVGVIESKVTDAKWKCWGELKGVKYGEEPSPDPDPGDEKPTLRKGSSGSYVTLLQTMLIQRGYNLPRYGADGKFGNETLEAVKTFQRDHGLTADGVVGPATWDALDNMEPSKRYTVTVPHLTLVQADALLTQYPTATKTVESNGSGI